jgi:hypothetical protein
VRTSLAAVSLVVPLLVLACGHSDQHAAVTPHGNGSQPTASAPRTAPNPDAVIL